MALIRIPEQQRTLADAESITSFLDPHGITYERWESKRQVPPEATADEVLAAYADKVDQLQQVVVTRCRVIDVRPDTPSSMRARQVQQRALARQGKVRFIVEAGPLSSAPGGAVFAIEVEAGDLVRVPRGTHHWFDLCADRRIRAIRLFEQPSGWAPHYTESGVDRNFQPVCFGGSYFPREDLRSPA